MSIAEAGQRPAPRVDPLTASIEGRITTAGSGAPVRRAEVRAIAASGFTRLALTDGDGRYTLRDMPAGEYRLHASRAGYVPLEYGQRRPLEAAKRITLQEGERAIANMALPRGAAIAGRVSDEAGEPLAGARVQALRQRTVEGQRRLVPTGAADTTDDTGAFRVYGMPPGDYFVMVTPPDAHLPEVPRGALPGEMPPNANARSRTRGAGRMFYPGTANIQEAFRITVGVGGEARADMQLAAMRGATVSGMVLDSTGTPVPDAMITLRSGSLSAGESAVSITGHAAADGTFELQDVPAGPYVLQAMPTAVSIRRVDGPNGPLPVMNGEFAEIPVTVGAAGISGLTVTTAPPASIAVSVVADSAVTTPLPSGLELSLRTASGTGPHMSMRSSGTSYEFRLFVMSAGYLQVNGLPDRWAVKAVTMNGVDITDQPIQPRSGASEVRVTLTDRVTEVSGTLSPAAGAGAEDMRSTVVVFAADTSRWTYPSRYLRTVQADEKGVFRISGLPGNERYLAVAVDYLEDGEGSDPEFLERIQDRAVPFTLGDAERRSISVPLLRR
jgi:hypothetical protein